MSRVVQAKERHHLRGERHGALPRAAGDHQHRIGPSRARAGTTANCTPMRRPDLARSSQTSRMPRAPPRRALQAAIGENDVAWRAPRRRHIRQGQGGERGANGAAR
jgi:hypothetical protein